MTSYDLLSPPIARGGSCPCVGALNTFRSTNFCRRLLSPAYTTHTTHLSLLPNHHPQLQAQLTQRRVEKTVATARAAAEDMVVELTEAQHERGRSVYGEAWDQVGNATKQRGPLKISLRFYQH